ASSGTPTRANGSNGGGGFSYVSTIALGWIWKARYTGDSVSAPWPWTTVFVNSSSTSKVSRRHALRDTPFAAQMSAINSATAGRVSRRAGKVLLWFPVTPSWVVEASGSLAM